MTTAELYRQKEKSAVIQVARYIFNIKLAKSKVFILGDLLEEIKTGKTPSKNEKKFYEDDFIDWYKPNEIGNSKFCLPSKEKLSGLLQNSWFDRLSNALQSSSDSA